MNALYVTVCIPFLLVLAGFNHAHGFTTFGKTPTNPQTQAPPRPVPAKQCGNHTDCWSIPKTSCVPEPGHPSRKSCLCGDNKAPTNGVCHAIHRGPNHMCSSNGECVEGSTCEAMEGTQSNNNNNNQESQKTCKCIEGLTAYDNECSGAGHLLANGITGLLLVALCRTLF